VDEGAVAARGAEDPRVGLLAPRGRDAGCGETSASGAGPHARGRNGDRGLWTQGGSGRRIRTAGGRCAVVRAQCTGDERKVVKAWTIRHRLRVVRELLAKLYGREAAAAVFSQDIEWPKKPKGVVPVTVDPEVIVRTLDALRRFDAQWHARFAVAATCGQRPCQIMRAKPEDLDLLIHRVWVVRNAQGEPAHPIRLNAVQVAAWQAFIAADAWGEFDTSKYGKVLRRVGWPKGIRPYNVRHSLAKAALRTGAAKLGDVQALLGHTTDELTRQVLRGLRGRGNGPHQRCHSGLPRRGVPAAPGEAVKHGAKFGAKSDRQNAKNPGKTRHCFPGNLSSCPDTALREWTQNRPVNIGEFQDFRWRARQDSNLRPLAPEANALSS